MERTEQGVPHGTGVTLCLVLLGGLITLIAAFPIRNERKKAWVTFLGALCTCVVTAASAYNNYFIKRDEEKKAHDAEMAQAAVRIRASILPSGLSPRGATESADVRPNRAPSFPKVSAVPIRIVDMAAHGVVEAGKAVSLLIATKNLSGGTLDVTGASLTGFKYLPSDPASLEKIEDQMWVHLLSEIDQRGIRQEMTTAGDGVRTQVLTGQPINATQVASIMDGSAGIFFVLLSVDSKTHQHFVEFCGYVNKDMNVTYCYHHNEP